MACHALIIKIVNIGNLLRYLRNKKHLGLLTVTSFQISLHYTTLALVIPICQESLQKKLKNTICHHLLVTCAVIMVTMGCNMSELSGFISTWCCHHCNGDIPFLPLPFSPPRAAPDEAGQLPRDASERVPKAAESSRNWRCHYPSGSCVWQNGWSEAGNEV